MDAFDLPYPKLLEFLMRGADDLNIIEASIRLLNRHGYWLRNREFLRFVEVFGDPPESAGIRWTEVTSALDEGRLRGDVESVNVLRISASISTFYMVSLRDVIERIGRENIKHVAEAIMYADGFLNSVADPRP